MQRKYFIDTCVWRDFYEDRISKSGNHLGEDATKLFMKIIKRKDKILFSESLIRELKKDYSEIEINCMLNLLITNKVLIRIETTKDEHIEAKELSLRKNIPYVDCLNAIQSKNNNCIMISQDSHFIKDLKDIAKRPNEVI